MMSEELRRKHFELCMCVCASVGGGHADGGRESGSHELQQSGKASEETIPEEPDLSHDKEQCLSLGGEHARQREAVQSHGAEPALEPHGDELSGRGGWIVVSDSGERGGLEVRFSFSVTEN